MSVSLVLSRLLHVSALVCAAVLSLFTCSASPVLTQVDNGVKHSILRSLYSPYNQNRPLYLPPEAGMHAGSNGETRTSGNLREVSSIIDQSNHQQLIYDQNSPHSKRPGTAVTEAWRRHRGGMRPASSRSDRPQPRGNYQPVNTNTYNDPQVIRKSSHMEAGSRFYVLPQFWPHENAPKAPKDAKYPGVFSFKMAGDEKEWTFSDFSLLSHPNRGYWSTALLTPRGRCSDDQKANGAQRTSVPRAPSLSQRRDAFVKNNPSLEEQTPSGTDFTQRRSSASDSETHTHQKAHSHPFKDTQTSIHEGETVEEMSSEGAARGYGSVSSSLIRFQQSHLKAPSEEAQHPRDAVRCPTTRPPGSSIPSTAPAPTQLPSLPASDKALESLAPVHHAGSHHSNGPGSQQPAVGRPVNKARGSEHDRKQAQSTKRLYGFRGFKSPTRSAGTAPSVLSKGHRFDKEKPNMFKTTNTFRSPESLRYSFHGASTTTQAKPEMTPTHSSSASSGFTKEGTEGDTHPNHRHVRVSKKIYGLRGFSSRPHEGAEASVREPDKPATQQDLEGFELRSSRLWPWRGSMTHSRGQAERGADRTSAQSQTKSQDFTLKAAGSDESITSGRFSADDNYAFLGFQPAEDRSRTHARQNSPTDSPRDSSADLTPAGGPTVEPSLTPEPQGEAVVQVHPLDSPTSSVVKATRVTGKRRDNLFKFTSSTNDTAHVAIVRLPKGPIGVMYADIVGSASFSHFRAGEGEKEGTTRADARRQTLTTT